MLDRDTRKALLILFILILTIGAYLSGGWSAFQFSNRMHEQHIHLDIDTWVCKVRKSSGECLYYQPMKK